MEVVCAVAGVINKSKHVEGDLEGTIGGDERSALSARGMTIKENAGNEGPVDRGIAAALTSAIDGISFAMSDELV